MLTALVMSNWARDVLALICHLTSVVWLVFSIVLCLYISQIETGPSQKKKIETGKTLEHISTLQTK